MMDFYNIKTRNPKKDIVEIYPDFKICKSKDLMVRGKSFYAIWDEDNKAWSTDEYDVQRLVDEELNEYKNSIENKINSNIKIKYMSDFSSNSWTSFKNYIKNLSDNYHPLNDQIIFLNTDTDRKNYSSKKVQYPLKKCNIDSYNKLMDTLYSQEERDKIEWAIGSVLSGESKKIQKFIVFYGDPGSGKSTVLNIIEKLFDGYYTTFEAKALTSSNNSFSTEVFKNNPLVAIQHDGDLSRIEDNTKLNSIISHEMMTINEKFKSSYMARINCFLFMATNKPVSITDAKSGIIRRLIDVTPTGNKLPVKEYLDILNKIDFELGGIAYHCLNRYKEMGRNYYSNYKPMNMIFKTDVFFNFVESSFYIFKEEDGISLSRAYDMYKTYCDESLIDKKLPKYIFREELKNYFKEFGTFRIDGKQVRSYYKTFMIDKIISNKKVDVYDIGQYIKMEHTISLLDNICKECPAQYANDYEVPKKKWSDVTTKLKDLDTNKVHYVKLPVNHIVIDFDLMDEDGNKSLELNLKEASKFPSTYAECSKSGNGLHLHYIYNGDVTKLSNLYDTNIEIKVFNGNSSLRRKLTKCNNIPIATINSGLPLKGGKMINFTTVENENMLRNLINKNLKKEIHPNTKPSIDFIYKILEDSYNSGLVYDVKDLRPKILAFANNSTNQASKCVKIVSKMKFESKNTVEEIKNNIVPNRDLVFFDVEVFPNLFLVNWKKKDDDKCVRMINPEPSEIEDIFRFNLVGFNCRRYDNHILYARYIGYSNAELFSLSQKIINGSENCMFREAYNISYTDVYDFASAANKKSLKKFEIDLKINHKELNLPWDKPVPEDKWVEVAEYCDNDVIATEKVFDYLADDYLVRQILSDLSGLSMNDTTNNHAIKIIFGDDKNTQKELVYTDLSTIFKGYKFENGVSSYRGENPSEGGYVYSEPGMYENVWCFDVASMHPTSIEQLNYLGKYTSKYSSIKKARLSIKHGKMDELKEVLDGKLIKYIEKYNTPKDLKNISTALKTVLNSVYGLTSASFDNPFRNVKNVDNIVAKRGSLFMIDLKNLVQESGYTVMHIKTDSIKIPNADDKIKKIIFDFGKKYGYEFEVEDIFDKICLINKSVYIAKKKNGEWTATGAQFAHPYVFKTLFSKEKINFDDMCETRSVQTAMYLDMNEGLLENEHSYSFVGRTGSFCPIVSGKGGGILYRKKDDTYHSVNDTKGYRWLESYFVKENKKENDIDIGYFRKIVDEAIDSLSEFGDVEQFIL